MKKYSFIFAIFLVFLLFTIGYGNSIYMPLIHEHKLPSPERFPIVSEVGCRVTINPNDNIYVSINTNDRLDLEHQELDVWYNGQKRDVIKFGQSRTYIGASNLVFLGYLSNDAKIKKGTYCGVAIDYSRWNDSVCSIILSNGMNWDINIVLPENIDQNANFLVYDAFQKRYDEVEKFSKDGGWPVNLMPAFRLYGYTVGGREELLCGATIDYKNLPVF